MTSKSFAFAAALSVSVVALHAQQPAAPAKPAAAKAATAVQKTPWGDPDISGVWTSDAAIGIPLQRPDRFNGRAELTDEEFKEKEARDAQTRNRAENAIGSFRNDNAWLAKSYRQTSLIIDPPDGKMPAVTPVRRDAPRLARSGDVRRRALRQARRLHDVRPLHHARHRRIGAAGRVRQRQSDHSVARPGGHQLRDGARHARHLHRRPATRRQGHPSDPRRLTRPLGRQHARRRDDEPDRQDEHRPQRQRPAPQRGDGDDRAHHARRRRTNCATRSSSTIRRRTSRRSRSRCRSCRRPDTSCCRTSVSKATTR